MMKWCGKILAAVDGSAIGYQLLRESIRLAHWIRAELTVVHVVPPYNGDLTFTGVGGIDDLRREPCRRVLDRVTEIAEEDNACLKAICLEGEPAQIILETAEKEACDLVVMGVYSKNILARIISGRTLKKVSAGVRQNMMIFPSNRSLDWQKIFLITDNAEYGGPAAELAHELVRAYGGELLRTMIPGILRPPSVRSGQTAQSKSLPSEEIHLDRPPFTGKRGPLKQIIRAAQQHKASLIVMELPPAAGRSCHRQNAFEEFCSSLPCPALICRPDSILGNKA